MARYLISYDLHRSRDYAPLHAQLRSWGGVPLLESVWLAELLGPAEVVRNILLERMDGDDGIAVIEIEATAEWATMRAKPAGTEWLERKVPFHDRAVA